MTQTLPPRDELLRMAPFALRDEGGGGGDGLTLDGYAAVFNRETIIDSWEGRFREQLANRSMSKSFRERTPKVQFDHGTHPLIGSLPIGRVESVREDTDPELAPEGGAHVVARLHDNWLVEPVRDAIASRSVDGMSFRFTVVREQWATADGKVIKNYDALRDALYDTRDAPDDELLVRTLKEVKVPELGPVVFPAYEATSVGVRSVTIDLGNITERSQQRKLAAALYAADEAERRSRLDILPDAPLEDEGHPSGTTESRSEDAPSLEGHPSDADDAPSREGHPSESLTEDDQASLRDELTSWLDFTTGHLARIPQETPEHD